MKKARIAIASILGSLALTFGLTMAPAQASYNYQGPYKCYPISGYTGTWFQATSWWLDSTHKRYHFAISESSSLNGTSWRYVQRLDTLAYIRTASSSDTNPLSWYWDIASTANRSFKSSWWKDIGGVPSFAVECSLGL